MKFPLVREAQWGTSEAQWGHSCGVGGVTVVVSRVVSFPTHFWHFWQKVQKASYWAKGVCKKCKMCQKQWFSVFPSGVINWSINGSINGSFLTFLDQNPIQTQRLVKEWLKLWFQQKTTKNSDFSHFCQKPYPILEAFQHFVYFDTTGHQLDTTVGQNAKSDWNPYPNPEEKSKMCQN